MNKIKKQIPATDIISAKITKSQAEVINKMAAESFRTPENFIEALIQLAVKEYESGETVICLSRIGLKYSFSNTKDI
jgi:hypothetical protein